MIKQIPEAVVCKIRSRAGLIDGAPPGVEDFYWTEVSNSINHVTLVHGGEAFDLPHRVEVGGVAYRVGWASRHRVAAYSSI